MKRLNDQFIIGVDHGYGNIKTANHCFRTGILGYDSEPLFTGDMLTYNGRYYLIGEGHKEFIAEKIKDEDYYLLTLVAIAKELKDAGLTEANIILAAGLPLTWTSGQKKEFAAYLGKNKEVDFNYKKVDYHITIEDVRIYPQGYAAIAEFASTMKGVNLVADIGNGTMNVLYMVNGRPQSGKMYTEKFGTYQCTLAIREMFMQRCAREINDAIIEEVLCTGTEDHFCGAYNFDVDGKYMEYTTPYTGMYKVRKTDELYRPQKYFNMYRWHITDPIYFKENLKVTIQALGWRSEHRYLPLQDDISSVAYWYSDTLDDEYPAFPSKNDLEII